MDHAAFHIVYVDKRVGAHLDGQYICPSAPSPSAERNPLGKEQESDSLKQLSSEITVVRANLNNLLSSFPGGMFRDPRDTLAELEFHGDSLEPTLVLLEATTALEAQAIDNQSTHQNDHLPFGPSSSTGPSRRLSSSRNGPNQDGNLLRALSAHITRSKLSSLIVPVAFVPSPRDIYADSRPPDRKQPVVPDEMLKCIDSGAVDVLFSPLAMDCVRSLISHAYRSRKNQSKKRASSQEAKKARKRSWVGIDDRKPYAYLREEIPSNLTFGDNSVLAGAINSWNFSAHEFSEDQLVHAAFLMLQHVLSMPELERWRLSAADLKSFLLASRAAYNSFVHYHNFRHVIDVMQAVYYFLLHIGTLPPYPEPYSSPAGSPPFKSPIGSLLKPSDALTLLISAIGHDVGHPGVNNAFLVALNAPLAQLYNDRSVLESFHCAAYSQILRRYWRSVFEDTAMRGLMINSILATDMGLHFKYMTDLGNLQEKVHHSHGTEGWSPQTLDEYRALTCALLIKCADISNVARPFQVAATWADILQLEFANQGAMENDLGMSTTLFGGPPELGNLTKLANSQNGFINIFARPLFEAVSDILPSMIFAIDEMRANQEVWHRKVEEQKPKEQQKKNSLSSETLLSPRSGSPSRSSSQPELSHPEGLPASQTSSNILTTINSSIVVEGRESRRAVPRSYQQDSRRSSSGAQFGHAGSVIDGSSYSRRSSSALSGGQGVPQLLSSRRSSNTSPSQLQLSLGHEARLQGYTNASAAENVQPPWRDSDGTLSHTNASTVTSETGSRNISIAGGGGSSARKGSKSSDGDHGFSQPRSSAYAMVRHSPYPALERHSSGGHTSRSQSVPYSPTETQATSVTEDSDDKGYQAHERGGSTMVKDGPPEAIDVEKPASGHRLTTYGSLGLAKGMDVKTSVVNGGSSSGQHSTTTDRLVTRKSSRFLNFWKKRGKATEPNA
ncbi:MAG: hypothetical protein L6R37_003771 [Teloschistes peruensis]|nr:MAG: hypothetical protein L6R37_003771 [Teloschistes peruensis]